MSDLLEDCPTAVKHLDRVRAELHAGEQVLFAADATVNEPTGRGPSDFNLYIGALLVTSERLLVAEGRAFGRVVFVSVPWSDVEDFGKSADGTVIVKKSLTARSRWPIWKISMWEGKSYKTPLDKRRLSLLAMSIEEARSAVMAARASDVDEAYEDLRRRRGV